VIIHVVPTAAEKQKSRFPLTISPYTNAEAVAKNTASTVVEEINVHPVVRRNIWRSAKYIQNRMTD
jgi:hypothetical protein